MFFKRKIKENPGDVTESTEEVKTAVENKNKRPEPVHISRRKYKKREKFLLSEKQKKEREKRVKKQKKVNTEKSVTTIGKGVNLDNKKKLINITIPDSHRARGTWVAGTTGSGKTRLMEGIIESDIRKGFNLLITDPKGDQALVSKVVHAAIECGRREDLMLITPIFPELSAKIDPLASYYMPEELVAHICSGVSVGDDPFFWNVSYRTASVMVQALLVEKKANGDHPSFNLKEIDDILDYGELQKLQFRLEALDASDERDEVIGKLRKILSAPQDYFSKIATSLQVAVDELTTGSVGRIIGKVDENRFLKRLSEGKGVIVIVQLGSMLAQRAGYTAGKVVLSMVQSYAGRIYASGKKMDPPLILHIDECQNVIWPGLTDLLAMAGSAGVWTHLYNQSISQLYDAVGEDNANSVLDNCNNKIFLLVPDAITSEYISRYLGEEKKLQHIYSVGGGFTGRKVEEPRVKPSDIMGLKPRIFYAKTYTGTYKGETLQVNDSPTKVQFPVPKTIRKISRGGEC